MEVVTSSSSRVVKKRVYPHRRNGLFDKDAPFWRGERAEQIVQKRVKEYLKKKPRQSRKSK